MNNVAINTTAFANVVTPFSPVGKQAVGLENADAKEEVFSPVEQPATESAVFDKEEEARASGDEKDRVKERREQEQQLQDQEQIRELASRDREVRAHEQAHASVGGQYAGAPSFTFERGPDG
ncbi:putative metalloprotease CJM1_0395 family protein [Oceanicoccus sp. KOV_DT_Chl]|uniref:putative metalloprotease CJM1_0395 family protein n=1 Tax=Oceanicoccus sp. KOV_DT_Chl TaxID=1904639 RepID=UPI00190ED765|nr:putative metalloprotease CJM1_0395 family protein [Oceanicoccus sp. KOV_DT_Chl]